MVEIGYGRILSRPGLTLRERELCVIAVLAGQNVAPQLSSHLRGAMRAGATAEAVRHAVLLAMTTTGFPNTIAAISWVEEVLSGAED